MRFFRFNKYRLVVFLSLGFAFYSTISHAKEINYQDCETFEEAIEKETREIDETQQNNHDELSQLYVSRGESYLLNCEYEAAINDFQRAEFHRYKSKDQKASQIVGFRVALGSIVCFDNLGMTESTQKALNQLQLIVDKTFCNHCKKEKICQGKLNSIAKRSENVRLTAYTQAGNHKNEPQKDDYEDILGPDNPPDFNWCEEVVVGTGRAMDAIAALAPNYAVKVVLIGIIEALIARGLKCCQTGDFWKACVAPIARKFREWDNLMKKNILPTQPNLAYFQG